MKNKGRDRHKYHHGVKCDRRQFVAMEKRDQRQENPPGVASQLPSSFRLTKRFPSDDGLCIRTPRPDGSPPPSTGLGDSAEEMARSSGCTPTSCDWVSHARALSSFRAAIAASSVVGAIRRAILCLLTHIQSSRAYRVCSPYIQSPVKSHCSPTGLPVVIPFHSCHHFSLNTPNILPF